MERYEYKVIPAPKRGQKARGIKGADGRFANALETVMNELAADGWEYLRADTLPSEERSGLTSKTTVFQNVLVFRRLRSGSATKTEPSVQTQTAEPAVRDAQDAAPSDIAAQ